LFLLPFCGEIKLSINIGKQAINDKLQGSVATYLRCGGVVSSQINKGLLMSLSLKFFKSVILWQLYKQECGCLVLFARLATTLINYEESARDNFVLACNFAKYSPILKHFSLTETSVSLS